MRSMPIYVADQKCFFGSSNDEVGVVPRTRETRKTKFHSDLEKIRATGEDQRELDKATIQKDWISTSKFEAADVKRRVHELFCEESNKLRNRQQRLKDLLRSEQYQYYDELACTKESREDKEEKMKEKAKELFAKKEAERVAFVLDKYEQQFRNNSEDLRNHNYGVSCEMVKREQIEQMKQKRIIENLKIEEEKAYSALWKADLEMKTKKEEELMKTKKTLTTQVHCTILKQIAEKEAKRKEQEEDKARDLEELLKELRDIEMDKLREEENKIKKMQENMEEINEFTERKRALNDQERLKEMQHNERTLEQMALTQTENKQAKQDKKDLKCIQDNYLKYNKFVKEERTRQERRDEQLFYKEEEMYWDKWMNTRKGADALQRCELMKIVDERKEMVEKKYEERRNRLKGDKEDREKLFKEVEELKNQDRAVSEKLHHKNQRYYDSLKCQMQYNRGALEDKLAEERRMEGTFKEAEDEYLKKVEYFKKTALASHIHPLKKHLMFPELSCKSILKTRVRSGEDGTRYIRNGTFN